VPHALSGRLPDINDFAMNHAPANHDVPLEAIARRYQAGAASLLTATLIADLETPVSAYLKLAGSRNGPLFLLESVEGGATRGRYSMIGLDPDVIWRCTGQIAEINVNALSDPDRFTVCRERPLDSLRSLLRDSAIEIDANLPPMAAGVFGYLGYDMVREMERLVALKRDPIGVPDAIMVRPTLMVIFDSVRDEIVLVTPIRPRHGISARSAYETAQERLDAIIAVLEGPLAHDTAQDANLRISPPVSNTSPDEFFDMVVRAKEYIRAGDIFQVVLSQRFTAPFALAPFALYRALRRVNPAPFLCFLDFGSFQIVCSSPEILVRLRDGKVTIRPIAGTRWRGKTVAEDETLAADLLADPKERAEHLMLLDLGRNDVGRVAQIGTVTVTDKFAVERYSHVMHIVSNVEGQLDPQHDAIAALSAGFPAGTVSGAPKVRAMQIIDELEKDKRGIYGGCIGYFGASGEMDTCIVLRTSIVKDGIMHVQAGAGIVYDSQPAYEQAECIAKAKALFRAAEEAVRFASRAKRGQ
jgi:anthranilate synthase component 1